MREHALFSCRRLSQHGKRTDPAGRFLSEQFEKLLCEVTDLACGRVRPCVLGSGEVVPRIYDTRGTEERVF